MTPILLIEVIPLLSDNAIRDLHSAIGRVNVSARPEPDWRQAADALEAEMMQRGVNYQLLSW